MLMKEIGEHLRKIREEQGKSLDDIAAAIPADKSGLSRLETGKLGANLDLLIGFVTVGLGMDWSDFCSIWGPEELKNLKRRETEEREARRLLEKLFLHGRRSQALQALKFEHGAESVPERAHEPE